MTPSASATAREGRFWTDELTPTRALRIVLFSLLVWGLVALYIRTLGPSGEFMPRNAVWLYLSTLVATIPLNWSTRKIAGMPPENMVSVVAVASAAPPTLEGVLMTLYPRIYGGDPIVIGRAAIWPLFAIGIAMVLATFTSLRANKRLRVGDRAPPIEATTVGGLRVVAPDRAAAFTHVQFLRFAGCPVCNLHLQAFIKRHAELRAVGVREVVLFHSNAGFIDNYYGDPPIDLIADPQRRFYARYRIETSPWALFSPLAWPGLVKGYRFRKAGTFDSTTFGLPADFLIDPDGRIVDCHYGVHAGDQWSVDDVLNRARGQQPVGAASPLRTIGVVG